MEIRKARIEDTVEILKLEELVWQESVTSKWDIGTYVRYGYVYVAYDGSTLCGVLLGILCVPNGIYVIDVVVHPKYRRNGVASRVYEALIKDVRSKPILTHVSAKDEISVSLHEKMGFRKQRLEHNVYGVPKDGPRILFEYQAKK